MATYFSILAWEIPWTEKPGGLQSMGLQKSWIQFKQLNRVPLLSHVLSSPVPLLG